MASPSGWQSSGSEEEGDSEHSSNESDALGESDGSGSGRKRDGGCGGLKVLNLDPLSRSPVATTAARSGQRLSAEDVAVCLVRAVGALETLRLVGELPVLVDALPDSFFELASGASLDANGEPLFQQP